MIVTVEPTIATNVQVRKATAEDAVGLALLGRVTFAETFDSHFKDKQGLWEHYEATFSVSKISRSLQDPNTIFWIATHNHLPVGYVKLKKQSLPEVTLPGRCSELEKIYVLKDYLSQGVGHLLQAALFKELRVLRSDNVWLYVWEENRRAIDFYQKHGFVVMDRNLFTVGRDPFHFLTMSKCLM